VNKSKLYTTDRKNRRRPGRRLG